MEYHTLTNVQSGDLVHLQHYIDNRGGDLRVGLRSITYTVGWYNVNHRESITWRSAKPADRIEFSIHVDPGLYNFEGLKDLITRQNTICTMTLDRTNGHCSIDVPFGWEAKLSPGLLHLLGLDDVGWFSHGEIIGQVSIHLEPPPEETDFISWRREDDDVTATIQLTPDKWDIEQFKATAENAVPGLQLEDRSGFALIRIPAGYMVHFPVAAQQLGLRPGVGWYDSGHYSGDRVVDFAPTKMLSVHLDQLSTSHNFIDGTPTSLLCTVGIGPCNFGDYRTVSFANPEYRRLITGVISQLKITVQDDKGHPLDNHVLPISVVLETRRPVSD